MSIATTTDLPMSALASPRVRATQAWVLSPLQDTLLIIAAPVLLLATAVLMFRSLGSTAASSLIIVAHIVITVAHHLPTFIRIYGDVELLRRYRWHFVLAPVVPLAFCAAVLGYINHHGYPVENFLYLYIMLALWDPWHFLRQHYGFTRIYDRGNAAPRALAARMDHWLCWAWFTYIMLASSAWLAGLLDDLYRSASIPLIVHLPIELVMAGKTLAGAAALAMTALYAGYLVWCRLQGHFISAAKLALLILTFATMYVAYVPNQWLQSLAPGWSFKVGFAVIGIVHMTQYLAIVWRYNRNLASDGRRARAGWFRTLHRRGGWLVGLLYVGACLAYGEIATTERSNRWIMSVLLSIGFTSTLLHYYFDGFIWKVRHQQNRDHLTAAAAAQEEREAAASWWTSSRRSSAAAMFARQLAYFGAPMLILTVGAVSAWSAPSKTSVQHMVVAQQLSNSGRANEAIDEAQRAYAAMEGELVVARKMARLDPSSAREAELAFLLYNRSFYGNVVLPAATGREVARAQRLEHRHNVSAAAEILQDAIDRGGPLSHATRPQFSHQDAVRTLSSWRRIAGTFQ